MIYNGWYAKHQNKPNPIYLIYVYNKDLQEIGLMSRVWIQSQVESYQRLKKSDTWSRLA